jgi:hypothetical protein
MTPTTRWFGDSVTERLTAPYERQAKRMPMLFSPNIGARQAIDGLAKLADAFLKKATLRHTASASPNRCRKGFQRTDGEGVD